MPRESYNVKVLRRKALASLRTGVAAFNGVDDTARTTVVLLSLQHAFEMLLKAILEEKKGCCCKVGRRAAKTQFLIP